MAEDSFFHIAVGFILFTLVGLMAITSVQEVGTEYNMNNSDVLGGVMNYDDFNNTASSIEKNSQDLQDKFSKGTIFSVVAGIVVDGIFGIGKDIFEILLTPIKMVKEILETTFKLPPVVSSVMTAIIVLACLFGIWSLLKVGT